MVPEFIALLTVSYRVFRETPGNIRMHTGAAFPSPVVTARGRRAPSPPTRATRPSARGRGPRLVAN